MRLDSSLDAAITDDHEAIIAAQTEILDSIVNLERAIGTGDGKNRSAFLQDHKVAYNTLTDQVLKRRNRVPRFDPLQKLPPELWIRIISLVLSSYWPPPAFFPDSIDVDAVLPLTLVSKWWQQALLGVAQFWTHISVDTRHPDSVAKAVMCFELSANLPISFDVVQRSRIEWDTIGPHILRNKHRIHQLHIRSYERDDEADYIAELDVLMLLLPLPNLRRMVSMWDTDHDDLKRILHACPSLQDMALRNLTERFLNEVNLNVFVKAEVYLSEIALLLEKNPPSIRSVRVSSNNPQDHLESLLGMPSLNGSDLGWQSLDWSNVLYPIPTKLLRRLVNLTSLTIDTTFTVIGELFNHLHNLPRLISLTIIIQVVLSVSSNSVPITAAVRPCPTIQQFRIHENYTNIDGIENHHRSIQHLAEVFNQALKSVNSMRTERFEWIKHSPGSDDSWAHLKDLTISTWRSSVPLDESWHVPPSVSNLSLSCFREQWLRLSSSSVTELRIRDYGSISPGENSYNDANMEKEKGKIWTFDDSQWPNLRKLTIYSRFPPIYMTNFSFVTKLVIGSSDSPFTDMDSYPEIFVTAICCQLATDPGIFPSLTSISSSWEPEWDIFFIMLERRNLHFRSKVASIREVVLPSRAAEVFYRPIHDILCGKFPERPSNHSLSLAGNIEILSDESITGCIFCLQSFIPCDEDAKESEQYSHIELPKGDFIPYPSSEEEILSTWRTRNEIWTRKWYPAIRRRRPLSCGRLDPTQTIIRQENCLGVWRIVSPYSSF